jgi:hypothetical protein
MVSSSLTTRTHGRLRSGVTGVRMDDSMEAGGAVGSPVRYVTSQVAQFLDGRASGAADAVEGGGQYGGARGQGQVGGRDRERGGRWVEDAPWARPTLCSPSAARRDRR